VLIEACVEFELTKRPPRRTFRQLAQSYLAGERTVEFAIEALLFAVIVAISAWPAVAAAGALAEFLQPRRSSSQFHFSQLLHQFLPSVVQETAEAVSYCCASGAPR